MEGLRVYVYIYIIKNNLIIYIKTLDNRPSGSVKS